MNILGYLSHRSWRSRHQSKHGSFALPPRIQPEKIQMIFCHNLAAFWCVHWTLSNKCMSSEFSATIVHPYQLPCLVCLIELVDLKTQHNKFKQGSALF